VDFAVFRPSTAITFAVRRDIQFNGALRPIFRSPAIDGDGKTDPAVYRGAEIAGREKFNNSTYFVQHGHYGDQPTPADYDGDGKADFIPLTTMSGTIKSLTTDTIINARLPE
jgi:hypothetical protein